jgi:hypothetical protein
MVWSGSSLASWVTLRHRPACLRTVPIRISFPLSSVAFSMPVSNTIKSYLQIPSLVVLFACQHCLALISTGLVLLVLGDHMYLHLLEDLGHDLAMGRPHPLSAIIFFSPAVTMH